MHVMASPVTDNWGVCLTACWSKQQRIHQSSASLAPCEGNPPVTGGSPDKRPARRKRSVLWHHHGKSHIAAILYEVANLNSLAPGGPRCHFKTAIFNLVLLIGIFTSSKDNALRWMPCDLTDDKSALVQVMAWCRQATSHYLSQCWPIPLSPYGVTKPQWVKKKI